MLKKLQLTQYDVKNDRFFQKTEDISTLYLLYKESITLILKSKRHIPKKDYKQYPL